LRLETREWKESCFARERDGLPTVKKITKYFCGLEKRNYISKQMTKLTLNNGEEIYESKHIIKEVKVFYERLYSERQVEDCEILDMAQAIRMLT